MQLLSNCYIFINDNTFRRLISASLVLCGNCLLIITRSSQKLRLTSVRVAVHLDFNGCPRFGAIRRRTSQKHGTENCGPNICVVKLLRSSLDRAFVVQKIDHCIFAKAIKSVIMGKNKVWARW